MTGRLARRGTHLLLGLALTGCAAPTGDLRGARYACADGREMAAVFDNARRRVTLDLKGGPRELPLVAAASGARYASADTLFWTRGASALLIADGRPTTCHAGEDVLVVEAATTSRRA